MTTRSTTTRWHLAAAMLCALLAACGAAEAPQVLLLDADALSADDAARLAAEAHGAPGEAEPLVYLVRARRRADARQFARELEGRGFEPVQVLP